MRWLLYWFLFPSACCFATPKIYDCFTFFNEIELLKCRFEELYAHVDYFVIAEGEETFQGNVKPLYFKENEHLFAKYLDKVRHVVVPRINTTCTWTREQNQRDSIMRGLYDADLTDIIFLSDVDEILRATKFPEIVNRLRKVPIPDFTKIQKWPADKKVKWLRNNLNQIVYLECYEASFFMNRQSGKMVAPLATQFACLCSISPDHIRSNRNTYIVPEEVIRDAGWHFSSLGGQAKWIAKLESFAHSEGNTAENKSWEHYLWEVQARKRIPIDSTFPLYVQTHQEELISQGYIDAGQFDWLNP